MRLKGAIRLEDGKTEYPVYGIFLVMVLILLSPFVSTYLCYVAFVICLCRMISNDAKVFATDYCILLPVAQVFRSTGGITFLIWLCLIAAVWYCLHGTIRANATLVFLLVLLNYLIIRMQMNISSFVLCFGQMLILYVLIPKQDAESAERTTKSFCWSLIITSFYALVLRNTSQLVAIRGEEGVAIWGTSIMRFSSLIRDPNYYMTMLVTGIAALCKLKETGRVQAFWFWVQIVVMTAFGILTYSKAFFIMWVLMGGMYIIWQFWSKKLFKGMVFTILGVVLCSFLLLSENSPFAVVLTRLTSSRDLSDITTNRSDLIILYWNTLTENLGNFLFGFGLNTMIHNKTVHMLYLEIVYYVGILGFVLIFGFFVSMVQDLQTNNLQIKKQSLISKYAVVAATAIQYLSLSGMFQVLTYGVFFVAFLSIKIIPKES